MRHQRLAPAEDQVSWSTGSIDWSCHGHDVPLSQFSDQRKRVRATYPPKRAGQLKVYAPCPRCDRHWVFIEWEEGGP
jgi:hypothetical protein